MRAHNHEADLAYEKYTIKKFVGARMRCAYAESEEEDSEDELECDFDYKIPEEIMVSHYSAQT